MQLSSPPAEIGFLTRSIALVVEKVLYRQVLAQLKQQVSASAEATAVLSLPAGQLLELSFSLQGLETDDPWDFSRACRSDEFDERLLRELSEFIIPVLDSDIDESTRNFRFLVKEAEHHYLQLRLQVSIMRK